MQNKKWILVYGHRRLEACRRLGWNTIPAYLKDKNEVIEVELKDIEFKENSRVIINEEELTELMQSIKQNNLLHPIGLIPRESFDKTNFLIMNGIENIHSKHLSPFEISRLIQILESEGLTNSQIALRLSISKSRVDGLKQMTKVFSPEELKDIGFGGNKKNQPFVSQTLAKSIANIRIRLEDKSRLLKIAKQNEFTVGDIDIIQRLIYAGMSLDNAIENRSKYKRCTVTVIFNKKKLDEFSLTTQTIGKYVNGVLTGKNDIKEGLVYYE